MQVTTAVIPSLREALAEIGTSTRINVELAMMVRQLGGAPLNYMRVTQLIIEEGRVRGVRVVDTETERGYDVRLRAVVNATGVFSDTIRQMENSTAPQMISISQGIHLGDNDGQEDRLRLPWERESAISEI